MISKSQDLVARTGRLASDLAESPDLESGLRHISNGLCSLLKCAAVGIWSVEPGSHHARLAAAAPEIGALPAPGGRRGVLQFALREQRAVTTDDPTLDLTTVHAAGYSAALAVPLVWRGMTVGVLGVFYETPDRDIEHDAELVRLVTPAVAGAVAQLQPDNIDALPGVIGAEQERLLHIQAAIRQMLDQPDLAANLNAVIETIRALGWQHVTLLLFSVIDDQVEHVYCAGFEAGAEPSARRHVIPDTIWDQLVRGELETARCSGLYCIYDEGPARATWRPDDLVFATLRVGKGAIVGVIRLDQPVDGRRPDPVALRAVDILANQTAYIIENARLLDRVSQSAETLTDQVEELSMMHRADRELSTHLDVERIMRLTMDWSLRRTNAIAGSLLLMRHDKRGLVPSVTMGRVNRELFSYDEQNPFPLDLGVVGRAARTGTSQIVRDVTADRDYVPFFPDACAQISVPLSMRGEVLGVITLACDRPDAFGSSDVSFLERLARRAAVAIDNARLYRQSEQLADDMAVIYTASRTITTTLEHDEILQRIAQAMTVALECSSAVIFDYRPELGEVQVLARYRLGTALNASETLPEIRHTMPVTTFPAFETAIEQQHPLVLRMADPSLSAANRQHLLKDNIQAMILIPLVAQNELIGLAVVIEGRHDRVFSSNDVFKVETLASQAAIALRQSMLYNEVLQLEELKSEMIRMASHDLRNPLNNIMGYIELLAMSVDEMGMTADQEMYLGNLRRSAQVMRSLLEDLLTLERIESDRQGEWSRFDLGGLVYEVTEEERSGVHLKQQTLTLDRPAEPAAVYGNITQLRQAITNLVGNAIKYTPDGGQIEVMLRSDGRRLHFEVADNGYGISYERQARLFERFYRAQEPGTDHIGGTGLGLSLVKTVVERHAGEVWFESTPGEGSRFGFWLPADEGHSDNSARGV